MICIGYNYKEKKKIISNYIKKNSVARVYVFAPEDRMLDYQLAVSDIEYITYKNLIEYEYFYRVLEFADKNTLIVLDECLRTKNRNDLTYNCIRHFLNQSGHQLIFQYLPIIDSLDDFMTLFDFDTKSQWKRQKFSKELLKECSLNINPLPLEFIYSETKCSEATNKKYESEKKKLFENLGLKDPHTIPRNLYLIPGKEKVKLVDFTKKYIGRNNRFKLENMETFKSKISEGEYIIFELPHNFIDFTDFLYFSKQTKIEILTTDSKIDKWYIERYNNWLKDLQNVYSNLR